MSTGDSVLILVLFVLVVLNKCYHIGAGNWAGFSFLSGEYMTNRFTCYKHQPLYFIS